MIVGRRVARGVAAPRVAVGERTLGVATDLTGEALGDDDVGADVGPSCDWQAATRANVVRSDTRVRGRIGGEPTDAMVSVNRDFDDARIAPIDPLIGTVPRTKRATHKRRRRTSSCCISRYYHPGRQDRCSS